MYSQKPIGVLYFNRKSACPALVVGLTSTHYIVRRHLWRLTWTQRIRKDDPRANARIYV